MTLHIVPKSPAPPSKNARRIAASKPSDMCECRRCGGREVIETLIGAVLQGGKLKGGTRQVICVGCLLNGERVVVA